MNLGVSSAVSPILKKLKLFIQEVVIPQEDNYNAQLSKNRWQVPAVMKELQSRAKREGLFNLFIEKKAQTFDQVD